MAEQTGSISEKEYRSQIGVLIVENIFCGDRPITDIIAELIISGDYPYCKDTGLSARGHNTGETT